MRNRKKLIILIIISLIPRISLADDFLKSFVNSLEENKEGYLYDGKSLATVINECSNDVDKEGFDRNIDSCLYLKEFLSAITDQNSTHDIHYVKGRNIIKVPNIGNGPLPFMVSYMYFYGHGLEKNYQEAYNWSTKSLEFNEEYTPAAKFIYYLTKSGKVRHYISYFTQKAWKVFHVGKQSGFKNFVLKMDNNLSNLSEKEKQEYYNTVYKKASNGDKISIKELGFLYILGIGTNIDLKQGEYWLSKSAESGDVEIQEILSSMYLFGDQFDFNFSMAKKWAIEATKNGSKDSSINLMTIYQLGLDGEIDLIKAYRHLYLSKDVNKHYLKDKQYLENVMTEEQIKKSKDFNLK